MSYKAKRLKTEETCKYAEIIIIILLSLLYRITIEKKKKKKNYKLTYTSSLIKLL